MDYVTQATDPQEAEIDKMINYLKAQPIID
jgi:hypothetical protein